MPAPLRPTDPAAIGRYELVARLGEGGMGTVYLGRAPGGRPVAIKVVRPEYAHEEEFRARFRNEVARVREVPPFCTAEVLDADPDHEPPYLVVEYVDGPSLNQVVAENGPLTGGNLHSVAVGVAAALAAVHGAGVIHRDLKPRNVLFALGAPKVIDFGIARPLEPTSFLTSTEMVVGTLAYMAPERLDAETDRALTPAVDVFAWGAVMVFAGTGRTPFGGDSPAVTAARILTQPPRLRGLPPYLAELVEAALDKDPEKRPTAAELLDGLLAPGAPTGSVLPPELLREAEAVQQSAHHRTVERRRKRRRWVPWAAAATIAATAVAFAAGTLLNNRAEAPPAVPVALQPSSAAPTAVKITGPSIFDPLLAGEFQSAPDLSCVHQRGLRVIAGRDASTMCGPTPDDVFPARQNVSVLATLGNRDSCATIWFRVTGDARQPSAGYRVAVCPAEVTLSSDLAGTATVATADWETPVGSAHRIHLIADERKATVWVDGTPVLHGLLATAPPTGRVVLGAAALPDGRAEVRFTDAQLRSGTAVDQPPVPAIATGDGRITGTVRYLTVERGVVSFEPTEFLSGAEYCRRFGTSSNCAAEAVPVPSAQRVTVPLADDVEFLDHRGSEKCRDPRTGAGVCDADGDFRVDHGDPPWPAQITTRDGRVTAIAKLRSPR